ncbi:RDD family protein [Candidatus Woesearchaeota archaeon]|nr:RDD family protein [Candidatus Woesearchaeota archaeon]
MKKYLSLLKKRSFKGPASIWKRLFAFILDFLLIDLICGYPFRRILESIVPKGSGYTELYQFLVANPGLKTPLFMMSIALGFIAMLYFAVLEYYTGQTIGKMLTNITVESETKKLAFWQCLVGNLFLIPIFPLILLWLIDPLWLLYTKGKKRLSDVLAKTNVVEMYTF